MLPLTYLPILYAAYNGFNRFDSGCVISGDICYFANYNRFNVHFKHRRIPLDAEDAHYRKPQVNSRGLTSCKYGCYVMKYLRENGTQMGCVNAKISLPMTSSFALGDKVLLFGVCQTSLCNTEKFLDDYGDRWYPLPSNVTTVAMTTSTASTSTTTEMTMTTTAVPTMTEVTTSTKMATTTTERILPTEAILHPNNSGCAFDTVNKVFTVVIVLLLSFFCC